MGPPGTGLPRPANRSRNPPRNRWPRVPLAFRGYPERFRLYPVRSVLITKLPLLPVEKVVVDDAVHIRIGARCDGYVARERIRWINRRQPPRPCALILQAAQPRELRKFGIVVPHAVPGQHDDNRVSPHAPAQRAEQQHRQLCGPGQRSVQQRDDQVPALNRFEQAAGLQPTVPLKFTASPSFPAATRR